MRRRCQYQLAVFLTLTTANLMTNSRFRSNHRQHYLLALTSRTVPTRTVTSVSQKIILVEKMALALTFVTTLLVTVTRLSVSLNLTPMS